MGERVVIRGNEATAWAAKLCRPDVIPAYPITPSTLFPEKISEYVANGEIWNAQFVPVESEHSAMSAAIGAAATGVRVTTATASQGLELMHEMLFIAAGMRLPIVMAIGNRALSAPINIWCDHADTFAARDCGWLQMFAEKSQEAMDLMIMAFRIAEDKRVLTPAMVGLDAFILTHTFEPVDVPLQEEVDAFLPPYNPEHVFLDPKRPITIGSFATPATYFEFKYSQEMAIQAAGAVIDEVFKDFEKRFGRKYQKLMPFMCDDAEIIIMGIGSMMGTCREAVKQMRAEGKKVGLLKMTVYRPFPEKELIGLVKNAKVLAVLDRDISHGYGGGLFADAGGAMVNEEKVPIMENFILGMGGRDILIDDFKNIVAECEKTAKAGKPAKRVNFVNVNFEACKGV